MCGHWVLLVTSDIQEVRPDDQVVPLAFNSMEQYVLHFLFVWEAGWDSPLSEEAVHQLAVCHHLRVGAKAPAEAVCQ